MVLASVQVVYFRNALLRIMEISGFTLYPVPSASISVVKPYNSVLATHALVEYLDIGTVLENQAISDLYKRSLSILLPTHAKFYRLIAQVVLL